MPGDLAPVALFAYRRPDHLAAVLASLARCPEAAGTALTVYCDGAKGPADAADVDRTRAVARGATGFASVTVIEADRNAGLAASIIAGVSDALTRSDTVIVLEDDIVVSPDFLTWMNAGLSLYRDEPRVVSLHAYVYPTSEPLPDSFFLRGADCWGWATWRRGWAAFDPDGAGLLDRLERAGLGRRFDFDGAYPYMQMLRDQVEGRNDSWAIRWYASAFLADLLTLYPGRSLVRNIGLDGSGTHTRADDSGLAADAHRAPALTAIPAVEDAAARSVVARALAASRKRPAWSRLLPGRRR